MLVQDRVDDRKVIALVETIGGSEEGFTVVEDGSVYQVGTYNGNPLGMAATRASLLEVLTAEAYAHLDRLNDRILAGCTEVIRKYNLPGYAIGVAGKGCVTFSTEKIVDYTTFKAHQDVELTEPGYLHDVFSAWHPLWVGGPAHAELKDDLARHGLEYLNTDLPTATAYPDGEAAFLLRTADENAAELDRHAPGHKEKVLGRIRELHEALAGFRLPPGLEWHRRIGSADPAPRVAGERRTPLHTRNRPGAAVTVRDYPGV